MTSNNNYFVKSMSQFLFLVVAKKVELHPNYIPGGCPQIIRLRVVKFEVDGSVCCSCDFLTKKVGIVYIHILAIAHLLDESLVDMGLRGALDFYFGVIMQALESF
jgi:hypothetical protein